MSRKRRVFDAIEHSSLRLLAQSTVVIIGYFYTETFLATRGPLISFSLLQLSL